VNLLLDTHALLWWLADDSLLSNEARSTIRNPENIVYVSAASAWEISIKRALGKLDAPGLCRTSTMIPSTECWLRKHNGKT